MSIQQWITIQIMSARREAAKKEGVPKLFEFKSPALYAASAAAAEMREN